MVVFEDGKPKRSDYKRFRIKHQEGNNDFLSMQEVVRRRFTRALAATPGTERMGEAPPSRAAFAETADAPLPAGRSCYRAVPRSSVLNGNGTAFRPTIEDDETAAEIARYRLDGGLEAAYEDTHGADAPAERGRRTARRAPGASSRTSSSSTAARGSSRRPSR